MSNIRVYRPPGSQLKTRPPAKKSAPKKKPWQIFAPLKKPKQKEIDYYARKFTDLSPTLIEATIHSNGKWVLAMMLTHFDDPTKVGDKFFTWASNLMRIVGGDAIEQALKTQTLYEFLQEEQARLKEIPKPKHPWWKLMLKKRQKWLKTIFKNKKKPAKRQYRHAHKVKSGFDHRSKID